jgi:hypothetical protein
MAVRGEGGNLKYEFHVKPGPSVKDVRLGYRGAEGLSVGAGGDLLVQTPFGVLKDAAPVSYQLIGASAYPWRAATCSRGMAAMGLRWGHTTLATRSLSTPGSTTPPSLEERISMRAGASRWTKGAGPT